MSIFGPTEEALLALTAHHWYILMLKEETFPPYVILTLEPCCCRCFHGSKSLCAH